ncbi:hypothetical protein GCM10009789_87790 [Kribbella sancticallisti]|uniref:Toprim domain-containing protein n=1 Tax=Kribbella sancticallisti TaxID=460087 RepID=A0ABN2EX68_9ACTN
MSRKMRQYVYTNPKGEPRISKVRYEPKAFRMFSWITSERKPEGGFWVPKIRDNRLAFSERAMYRLPELLQALRSNRRVAWCEGEKDADALVSVGVAATSHWQGASEVHICQASWFTRGTGRIYIVVDVDEAGAYSGCLRYDALCRVGVDRSRLRIVAPPHPHTDAAEAVEAGLRLRDFRRVPLSRLRPVAASYLAQRQARRGSSDWQSAS